MTLLKKMTAFKTILKLYILKGYVQQKGGYFSSFLINRLWFFSWVQNFKVGVKSYFVKLIKLDCSQASAKQSNASSDVEVEEKETSVSKEDTDHEEKASNEVCLIFTCTLNPFCCKEEIVK